MRRGLTAACAVAAVAALTVILTGWVSNRWVSGGPPSPSASPPPEVTRVAPAPGSRVCPRPLITVDLRLTDALRKAGVFDPSTITLVLDGRDITGNIRAAGTMDYPQGHVSLVYTPAQALAPGPHTVVLTIATGAGSRAYQWTFTVADVPCP